VICFPATARSAQSSRSPCWAAIHLPKQCSRLPRNQPWKAFCSRKTAFLDLLRDQRGQHNCRFKKKPVSVAIKTHFKGVGSLSSLQGGLTISPQADPTRVSDYLLVQIFTLCCFLLVEETAWNSSLWIWLLFVLFFFLVCQILSCFLSSFKLSVWSFLYI
jgi:hypothetical protein